MAFCHSRSAVKCEMITRTTRHKKYIFKLDWFDHMIKEMGVFNMWFHLNAYDDRCVGVSVLFFPFFLPVLRCRFSILLSKSTINTDEMMMWQRKSIFVQWLKVKVFFLFHAHFHKSESFVWYKVFFCCCAWKLQCTYEKKMKTTTAATSKNLWYKIIV